MAYANWGQRVAAYLIDYVIPWILVIIGVVAHNAAVLVICILLAIGIGIYNRWYQAGQTGQSWGRMVLNIKLIDERTGQPIGMLMAFVRDIVHILDGIPCYIGYLWPLWDAKRQTFADKILNTVVVPV